MEEKITLEEHKQLGRILKDLRAKLRESFNRYGTKKCTKSSSEMKAYNLIDTLKNRLEEIMTKDYPTVVDDKNLDFTQIYYGL